MFPTLAILNAPKSGTPDFGVKPGNDGGNRGTSVLHPFDRDLLLVALNIVQAAKPADDRVGADREDEQHDQHGVHARHVE